MKSTSAASVEGKLNYATSAHSTVLDSWGISWNQGGKQTCCWFVCVYVADVVPQHMCSHVKTVVVCFTSVCAMITECRAQSHRGILSVQHDSSKCQRIKSNVSWCIRLWCVRNRWCTGLLLLDVVYVIVTETHYSYHGRRVCLRICEGTR